MLFYSHPRVRFLIALAMMASLAAISPCLGQNNNAASYYQRAIDALDEANFTETQWEQFYAYQSGSGGQPSAQVETMLRQLQPVLELTRRASSRDYSDFGLDYSQGIDLLLPHLSKMRTIARIMDADTKVRLHNGDTSGAARNLASVYHMGSHSGDDRTLISALVGNAIFAIADEGMQYGFDHGVFNEADAAVMLGAADDLRADDPFQMVESLMMEGDVFIGWIQDELAKEGGPEQLAQTFADFGAEGEDYLEIFSSEDVDEQFAKIDGVMNEVVEVFSMEDREAARAQLAEIEERVVSGEYGEIAKVLLPAYGVIYERMVAAEDMLAARKEMLTKFVRGEIKAADALNAAVLYMQSIDAWLALEASHRQHVRNFVRSPDAVSDDLKTALLESRAIIETLTQASQLKRCDFKTIRGTRHSHALCERYVIGMREMWDLLLADAITSTRANDIDAATDRIATSLRMVPHLASDHTLAGAVTCQYAFNNAALLLVDLLDDDRLTDAHLATLRPVVLGVERRDPFGAIDTMIDLRESAVAAHVSSQMAESTPEAREEQRAYATDIFATWTGDHFLYVRAAQEHAEQQEQRIGADDIVEEMNDELTLDRMDGIFSLEALAQIQRDGGYVLSLLEQGEIDAFAGLDIPLLTRFHENHLRARNDVRTIHRVLRLSAPTDSSD